MYYKEFKGNKISTLGLAASAFLPSRETPIRSTGKKPGRLSIRLLQAASTILTPPTPITKATQSVSWAKLWPAIHGTATIWPASFM